ncbi:MAG: acylneuraminate cytidylyltransferase [Nitrospirae bacterium]|nr:acylneuraminate cytidylyltransferase [Nitrospirota bacterium]
MSERVVAIVQARMGSRRRPGKSFEPIGGVPVVEVVLRRLARAREIDRIVLATSALPQDTILAEHAARLGFAVFRGSENDLVDRYYRASLEHPSPYVVRVTGDNVFLAWTEMDRLVQYGLSERMDFVGWKNPTFPDRENDFAGEFIRFECLKRIHEEATEPHDREHVFPYFYKNMQKFKVTRIEVAEPLRTRVKLDLDYPRDLALLQEIGRRVGDVVGVEASEVVRVAEEITSEPRSDVSGAS